MVPKGKLIIIGGAEDKGEQNLDIAIQNAQFTEMEIIKKLVPEDAPDSRIEVVTTASNIPDEVKTMYEKAFEKAGFKNVGFIDIQDKQEAREEKHLKSIAKAHTVLFSGGDQYKIATIIGGTPFGDAICEKYRTDKNFVVAGTSAGAMVLSKIMIQRGGTQEALFETDLRTSSGLGLLEDCIVDTHFVKRGRFGRLAHAVVSNPGQLGIGLGEDTALMISKGNEAQCLGSGMVVIIDGRGIEKTNIHTVDDDCPIFVENLKVHLLVKNCIFRIAENEIIAPKEC